MFVQRRQQPTVKGFEGGSFQFAPRLGHGAFGGDPPGLAGERLEQFIKQGLEAAFPSAEQESHEDWESEDTLAGKCLDVGAVS